MFPEKGFTLLAADFNLLEFPEVDSLSGAKRDALSSAAWRSWYIAQHLGDVFRSFNGDSDQGLTFRRTLRSGKEFGSKLDCLELQKLLLALAIACWVVPPPVLRNRYGQAIFFQHSLTVTDVLCPSHLRDGVLQVRCQPWSCF